MQQDAIAPPRHASLVEGLDAAETARSRGDQSAALSMFAELRERFPEHPAPYLRPIAMLSLSRRFDDAASLLAEGTRRFPDETGFAIERAHLAQRRGEVAKAIELWRQIREALPDHHVGYTAGAQALRYVGRIAEAETLLVEAMRCFPDDPAPHTEYAWIAQLTHDWPEATRRWEAVRRQFPEIVAGYTGGARVLRDQLRLGEAETLLEEAQRRFPDDPVLLCEHARIPLFHPQRRERDAEEAMRRIERLLAKFPLFEEAYLLGVRTLRELARPAEADELAEIGIGLLPNSATLAIEHANNVRERGDWPEAVWRYGAVRQRFPEHAGGPTGLAAALSQSGRHAEAETVLSDAMQRFPAEPAVFAEFARVAARREEWGEALARWREAQRRFPDQEFAQRIFEAELRLSEAGAGQSAPAAGAGALGIEIAEPDPGLDRREATRELLMQFESLGGDRFGGEFGMVQREFGAEPIGLLRWADMPYEGIVAVLENRFDGIGAAEHTELFIDRENSRPEYGTRDRRGFMSMRAFIYEDDLPFERMRQQALRRLTFLKHKLIGDLEAGGRIFVYRLTDRDLDPPELERLHRAVRFYGDSTLLYVRRADAAHPNGTVEPAAPGLMIGYIDCFQLAPDGQLSAGPPSASWRTICQKAYALFAGDTRADEPSAPAPQLKAETPVSDQPVHPQTDQPGSSLMPRWEGLSQDQLRDFFVDYGAKIRRGELRFGRHHYALAMGHAIRTAIHCGCGHVTAVELGVATGAGLIELCQSADYLISELGVEISVVGFDRAEGLPSVSGYMDHPELWHTGAFKMPDPTELAATLPKFARLVIGDIAETLPRFEPELRGAPLAFAAFDVDLYTSTKQALEILKFAPQCYLPVVPATFDDSDTVLSHSRWCGEAAAVHEFNEANALRKIDPRPNFDVQKFYCCQIFDHPIRQGTVRSRLPLSLGKF